MTPDFLRLVGTNHFGHFALNKLLLPMVNPTNGKIVVTASGVHDPESPGKIPFCDPLLLSIGTAIHLLFKRWGSG